MLAPLGFRSGVGDFTAEDRDFGLEKALGKLLTARCYMYGLDKSSYVWYCWHSYRECCQSYCCCGTYSHILTVVVTPTVHFRRIASIELRA